MTGHGRRGKPNAGFPQRPQPLEIAARFPHSHGRDEALESGKPNPGFPTFQCTVSVSNQIQRGGLAAELRSSSRLIVRLENANQRRFSNSTQPRSWPMTTEIDSTDGFRFAFGAQNGER